MRAVLRFMRTRIVAAIILMAIAGAPTLGQSGASAVVPGHSFGPVMLGMPANAARAVAARFERTTGCAIDLLVAGAGVIAAGSSWGGCLSLQLPSGTTQAQVSAGPFFVQTTPFAIGTGGPPAILINAFGLPFVERHDRNTAVLLFVNGLVAHVGATHMRGGVVDYLAVQASGTRTIPRIGYLADVDNVHVTPLYSDGGSGTGFGNPPTGP